MFLHVERNNMWPVIGISGCTNSGKTTLAKYLREIYPGSVVINQDVFFRPDDDRAHVFIPELNHNNYDRLEAINWSDMLEYVIDSATEGGKRTPLSLLIIEGHLIFNYPPLVKLIHKKYFLKMEKEECYRRRCTRVYDPPDVPGYFEKCVWPMYLSNLDDVERKNSDIMYLSGMDPIEDIREKVLSDLKKFLIPSEQSPK